MRDRNSKRSREWPKCKRYIHGEELADSDQSASHDASGQRPVSDQASMSHNPDSAMSAAITSAQSAFLKGTPCPRDFVPDEQCEEFALILCPDLHVELELAKFLKHWCSKTGRNALKKDWHGLFRRWLRRAQDSIDERKRLV